MRNRGRRTPAAGSTAVRGRSRRTNSPERAERDERDRQLPCAHRHRRPVGRASNRDRRAELPAIESSAIISSTTESSHHYIAIGSIVRSQSGQSSRVSAKQTHSFVGGHRRAIGTLLGIADEPWRIESVAPTIAQSDVSRRENGDVAGSDDALGHAADEVTFDPRPAVRPHRDEIDTRRVNVVGDSPVGCTLDDLGDDVDPALPRPRRQRSRRHARSRPTRRR